MKEERQNQIIKKYKIPNLKARDKLRDVVAQKREEDEQRRIRKMEYLEGIAEINYRQVEERSPLVIIYSYFLVYYWRKK